VRKLILAGLVFVYGSLSYAQGYQIITGSVNPTGTCTSNSVYTNQSNGTFWTCVSSAWSFANSGTSTAYLKGDGTWAMPSASAAWGNITGTLSAQTDLQTVLNAKAGLNKAQMSIFLASGTWTNMPSAQTVGFGTWVNASKVDLSLFTQGRLIINKLGTAGAASAVIRLRYATSYSQTIGNYSTMGSSEIRGAVNVTNSMIDSGWINLVAGAKADNIFIVLDGVSGDGVLDPVFGNIQAQFR
jgi:hypothetical protein